MGSSLDLIGLQEVRTVVHEKYTVSQMQLLQQVLPNYQVNNRIGFHEHKN